MARGELFACAWTVVEYVCIFKCVIETEEEKKNKAGQLPVVTASKKTSAAHRFDPGLPHSPSITLIASHHGLARHH